MILNDIEQKYGQNWTSQPCPSQYRAAMPAKKNATFCYYNAFMLLHNKNLRYCEGHLVRGGSTVPVQIQHAWCVDKQGRVVDPTWAYHPDTVYFGVPFTTKAVCRAIRESKNEAEGLFTDWIWKQNATTIRKSVAAVKPQQAGCPAETVETQL